MNETFESFKRLKPFIKEGMEDKAYLEYIKIWKDVIKEMGGPW